MKRVFMLLLAALLLTGWCGMAETPLENAETEALHLLWDIPFHILAEECLVLLEEKTGARMEIDNQYDDRYVVTQYGSHVALFGYPATLSAKMNCPDRKLGTIWLTFDEFTFPAEEVAEGARACIERFESLRQKLTEQYGPYTNDGMTLPFSKEETELVTFHRIPLRGDAIDYEEIEYLTTDTQVEFDLFICWGNVILCYYSFPAYKEGHLLTVDVSYRYEMPRYTSEEMLDYARPNFE